MKKTKETNREIDQVVSETYSWWGKSYIFMKTTQVRSLHATFILAFFVGIAAALIWGSSTELLQTASAAEALPKDKCVAQPAGGRFLTNTAVSLKCGSKVTNAFYQWNNESAKKLAKEGTTYYFPISGIRTLTLYSEAVVQKLFFKQKVKFSNKYIFKPAVYPYPYPYSSLDNFFEKVLAVNESKQKLEIPTKEKLIRTILGALD